MRTDNWYDEKIHWVPQYQKLIHWLQQSREEQGLSMRALAERLAVPHSFVQKVETMERKLADVLEYVVYCEALGLEPAERLQLLSYRLFSTRTGSNL